MSLKTILKPLLIAAVVWLGNLAASAANVSVVYSNSIIQEFRIEGSLNVQNTNVVTATTVSYSYNKSTFITRDLLNVISNQVNLIFPTGAKIMMINYGDTNYAGAAVLVTDKNGEIITNVTSYVRLKWSNATVWKGKDTISGASNGKQTGYGLGMVELIVNCPGEFVVTVTSSYEEQWSAGAYASGLHTVKDQEVMRGGGSGLVDGMGAVVSEFKGSLVGGGLTP